MTSTVNNILNKTNQYYVKKFITIENNEIKMINDMRISDKPNKIISFIGNARTGKSTLMNCFLSYLFNDNIKLFNTSANLNSHCTTGIDMLELEFDKYNLILLDVQGLELQDSSDDCKLIIFVYLISNLIIFNPKTILDNTVLSSLQSLTSIITYYDNIDSNKNKPGLFFRPRDINPDAEFDPTSNLSDMLSDTKDQFLNVRSSIKKLFHTIESVPTYSLDRKELKLLSNNNFIDFINNTDNGFKNLCSHFDNIITNIKSSTDKNNFINIIENINGNKKIDFNIFDITKREAELDIKEWILKNINISMYDEPIESDGTQLNYDTFIQPRIDYSNEILAKFDERFIKTTPKIKATFRKEINDIFMKHINDSTHKSQAIANTFLSGIYNDKIKTCNYNTVIHNVTGLYSGDTNWINFIQIEEIKQELFNYIKNTVWLESVKTSFLIRLNIFINSIETKTMKMIKILDKKFNKYINEQSDIIKTFIDEQNISDNDINNIYMNFNTIIGDICSKFNVDIIDKLVYPYFEINISYDNSKSDEECNVNFIQHSKKRMICC